MHRKVGWPLVALVVAACGDPFTTATEDGGSGVFDGSVLYDGSIDTGLPVPDGSLRDGPGAHDAGSVHHDAALPHDAALVDVSLPDDAGSPPVDAGSPPVDAGADADASACLRACPSGFDCLSGSCEDRAALHFADVTNPSSGNNWSYGSFGSNGSTPPFAAYPVRSKAGGLDLWGDTAGAIEPSVFHNPSLTPTAYDLMNVPPRALGLFPQSQTIASVVRWTAPQTGQYAFDATFTGLGAMQSTMTGAYVNIGALTLFSNTINAFMGPNSVTYTNPAQMMVKDGTADFYVQFVTSGDDLQGGTQLEARITAN